MPIFEYKCKNCGKKFETLITSKEAEESLKCINCGSDNLEKLLSASFVSVKGESHSAGSHCGQDTPCCGAPSPCDKRPCDD